MIQTGATITKKRISGVSTNPKKDISNYRFHKGQKDRQQRFHLGTLAEDLLLGLLVVAFGHAGLKGGEFLLDGAFGFKLGDLLRQ